MNDLSKPLGCRKDLTKFFIGDAARRVVARDVTLLRKGHYLADRPAVSLNGVLKSFDCPRVMSWLRGCAIAAGAQGRVGESQDRVESRVETQIIRDAFHLRILHAAGYEAQLVRDLLRARRLFLQPAVSKVGL